MTEFNVRVRFSPALASWGLATLLLGMFAAEPGTESLRISTYYPAPSGVYSGLLSAQRALLARGGGNVGVGTTSPGSALDVKGAVRLTADLSAAGVVSGGDVQAGVQSVLTGVDCPPSSGFSCTASGHTVKIQSICGSLNQACCAGSACGPGLACQSGTCESLPCGAFKQICCAGSTCGSGLMCQSGSCQAPPCGAAGQNCCAGSTCGSGLACQTGTCQVPTCGALNQNCCAGSKCGSGMACLGGTCQTCPYICGTCTATYSPSCDAYRLQRCYGGGYCFCPFNRHNDPLTCPISCPTKTMGSAGSCCQSATSNYQTTVYCAQTAWKWRTTQYYSCNMSYPTQCTATNTSTK